jgi:acetyl esterase/lipase
MLRRLILRLTGLVPVGLIEACSPTVLLNALAPRDGVRVQQDIPYGAGPRRRLDVYTPSPGLAAEAGNTPVVVFFYGGRWQSGERAMYRFVGAALAARGVATVIPDYRLYPEVRFPRFVEDAAAAVGWARAHAGEFGGDARRLFLMGHSAGAHIAALLALDGGYLRAQGLEPRDLCGVVGLAGPYDFLPLRSADLIAIFGSQADWPRSQPIAFAGAAPAPPMLLATGDSDDSVDPGNARRLAARLNETGAAATVTVYPGVGHAALIGAFGTPFGFLAPVLPDLLRFMASARPVAARAEA